MKEELLPGDRVLEAVKQPPPAEVVVEVVGLRRESGSSSLSVGCRRCGQRPRRRAKFLGDQAGAVGPLAQDLDPLGDRAPLLVRQPFQRRHQLLERFGIHASPRGLQCR